jgi:hypothetical protein
MTVEQSERESAGEIEVHADNLSQCQFAHRKSHLPDPGLNPDRRDGKPTTNRLSCGTAAYACLSNG